MASVTQAQDIKKSMRLITLILDQAWATYGPGPICSPPVLGRHAVSTWNVLVGELDVDDVISWLGGAVCDLAGAVLLVLCVDVHFAGTFDGQAQAAVA